MAICTAEDDYVRLRPRWVATLSDGTTVYADDHRPGESVPFAWRRLRAYCEANALHVVDLWLQFRSHRVHVEPSDADGYYFAYLASRELGEGETRHGYLAGTLIGDTLTVVHYSVPELQPLLQREVHDIDYASPSLIRGPEKIRGRG